MYVSSFVSDLPPGTGPGAPGDPRPPYTDIDYSLSASSGHGGSTSATVGADTARVSDRSDLGL